MYNKINYLIEQISLSSAELLTLQILVFFKFLTGDHVFLSKNLADRMAINSSCDLYEVIDSVNGWSFQMSGRFSLGSPNLVVKI